MNSEQSEKGRILGLDIGIGSIGWAILDLDRKEIVGMGAHLFDPPQENKTKASLAATRRAARSQRRNVKRSADRRKHCLEVLKNAGLVPREAGLGWIQMSKGDTQILEARAKGLDRKLTDREFAQALFSLCKRRGYIPHGEREPDAEGRKVLGAIQANAEQMAEHGWRTVGEMLFAQGSSRNKAGKYDKCVTHAQLIEEAKALFEAQRSLGNAKATERLEEEYLACMSWQKDTSGRDEAIYRSVARCQYFPEEARAAKACLSFEMCVAYERLCHTTIVMQDGSESKLPAPYRAAAIRTLFSPTALKGNKDCKVRYSDARKALDLSASAVFKGIDPAKEKDLEISKPIVWRLMRSQLSEDLMRRMREDRALADGIGSALAYSSSEKTLRDRLSELGLTEREQDELATLPYSSKVFSGYGSRSLKALDLLIDSFEDVERITTLAEAMEASGLKAMHEAKGAKHHKLPPYDTYDETCSNPVVLRVMGRLRKVVNATIELYGMPDEIHVELARELKHSAREKAQIAKGNAERRASRDACRKEIAEELGCLPEEVAPKLVRKLELWKQQDGLDVYTGKPIPYGKLLLDDTCCDIDHVLPYSRTCDDSSTNKVLTTVDSNRSKGNRTPFEWLSEDGSWEEFRSRVSADRKIPFKKKQKLLEEHLQEREVDFIERNLNDTRYATRAAHGYLADCLEFPPGARKRHVYAVAGGATSALRGAWGFAAKDREADDTHHAVDAAIVAACSAAAVIKVARASESKRLVPKEERVALFEGTEPWAGFAREVEDLASEIVPTRMVDHGGTARLFEDFRYRFDGIREDGKKALLTRSGQTKPYGNYVIARDGSAMLPDGMAFLRMWWDEATSKYLPEPVYYADLEAIRKGTHVPRAFSGKKPRPMWEPLPETARGHHVDLRYGTPIIVNGKPARYLRFNSASGAWVLKDIRQFSSEPLTGMSIGSIRSQDGLKVIPEDILGQCYKASEDEG